MNRFLLSLAAALYLACSFGDTITQEKGPLAVVIVEETSDRAGYTVEQLKWLSGTSFSAAVRAKGHSFAQVDKDVVGPDRRTPPPELAPFLAAAKDQKLPALTIRTASGRLSLHENVPSEAAAIAAVLKAGGG